MLEKDLIVCLSKNSKHQVEGTAKEGKDYATRR